MSSCDDSVQNIYTYKELCPDSEPVVVKTEKAATAVKSSPAKPKLIGSPPTASMPKIPPAATSMPTVKWQVD